MVSSITERSGIARTPASSTRRRAATGVKRGVDLFGAAALLLLLAPLLAACALAVLLLDGRPILFRQRRVGRGGVPFSIVKFRTMVPDADARLVDLQASNERSGPLFKMHHDPRVTRVGRVLRRVSLDELPQLFNVLAGSMSLVGPRPALPSEVAHFDDELLDRHLVRPGMTGLWQVRATDMNCFATYRRLDLAYARGWTMRLDVELLAETASTIVRQAVGSPRTRADKPSVHPTSGAAAGAVLLVLPSAVDESETSSAASTIELDEAPCAS